MFRYFILKSYISIFLFLSFIILPCTAIKNANAGEYQSVSHNESVNIENHKDRDRIAQGILDFSFGEKEKIFKKDGVASRINKKKSKQHNTRIKKSFSGAKNRAPTRSFLDGGPLPQFKWTKKKEKSKRKKLSLPTWSDK